MVDKLIVVVFTGNNTVVVLVKELIPETLEFRNNTGGEAFPEGRIENILQHNKVLLK